jgi:hypothetical protein
MDRQRLEPSSSENLACRPKPLVQRVDFLQQREQVPNARLVADCDVQICACDAHVALPSGAIRGNHVGGIAAASVLP